MDVSAPRVLRVQVQDSKVEEPIAQVVVVAIPCHNEERFIGSVVLKAKRYVNHVLVIDDGSIDDSASIAETAGAIVIPNQHAEGKGAAASLAFQEASRLGADVLILIDGDGQHDAGEIPKLLKPIFEAHADIVVGSRFLRQRNRIPRYRALGQHIFTFVTNLGSGVKLTDSQCGFRAFSRKAIRTLSFCEQGFAIESEMQFRAKEKGLNVTEIPITTWYEDKAKRSPVAHGLGVLTRILSLINQRHPLLCLSLPGAILLLAGIILGLIGFRNYNAPISLPLGQAFASALLCAIGLLVLFAGIMLHWLRNFLELGQGK